jgi:invasion protein IalB
LRIDVQTGVSVADGVKVSLNQRRFAVGGFEICRQATCSAELPLSDADLSLLRSGSHLEITFVANGMENEAGVGLDGLARALDKTPPTSADLALEQRKICLQLCEQLICRRKPNGGCRTCADCR